MFKNQSCNRILHESTLTALERQGSELSKYGSPPQWLRAQSQELGSLKYNSMSDPMLQPHNQTLYVPMGNIGHDWVTLAICAEEEAPAQVQEPRSRQTRRGPGLL